MSQQQKRRKQLAKPQKRLKQLTQQQESLKQLAYIDQYGSEIDEDFIEYNHKDESDDDENYF